MINSTFFFGLWKMLIGGISDICPKNVQLFRYGYELPNATRFHFINLSNIIIIKAVTLCVT